MPEFWKKVFHLREKTAAELQAEKYYKEIGETDPFLLARKLNVSFSYVELGNLIGVYKPDPSNPDQQRIYINKDSHRAFQEDVLAELLYHHLESTGTERSFTKEELRAAVRSRQKNTLWWL
jgi:hypothetical protein